MALVYRSWTRRCWALCWTWFHVDSPRNQRYYHKHTLTKQHLAAVVITIESPPALHLSALQRLWCFTSTSCHYFSFFNWSWMFFMVLKRFRDRLEVGGACQMWAGLVSAALKTVHLCKVLVNCASMNSTKSTLETDWAPSSETDFGLKQKQKVFCQLTTYTAIWHLSSEKD